MKFHINIKLAVDKASLHKQGTKHIRTRTAVVLGGYEAGCAPAGNAGDENISPEGQTQGSVFCRSDCRQGN